MKLRWQTSYWLCWSLSSFRIWSTSSKKKGHLHVYFNFVLLERQACYLLFVAKLFDVVW